MATIDLGKISFTQKGTWASGTTYEAKDVVQYTDDNETSSYVAIASSTNQAPSTNGTVNTSYWQLFAKGSTIGSTNEGVWNIATAYQKNAVVQYTDSGVVSTYLAITDSTGQTPSTAGTVNSTYWQLIAKGTDSVGLSWQSTIVTGTTLTAQSGNGYWIDTTSNACTVTLPASASVGDTIEFSDYARTWGTNSIEFDTNGLNYQGNQTDLSGDNPTYNTNGQHIRIVYSGATQGWIPTVDDDVTLETSQTYDANFLVIAGGGGGGYDRGGGGGAGGYRNSTSGELSGRLASAEQPLAFSIGTVYTITVGAGGSGAPNNTSKGTTGSNSSISGSNITTITSNGGGGGGTGASAVQEGLTGGSGAGSGNGYSGALGTAGQGHDGGDGNATHYAGGGGGAGAEGNVSGTSEGGNGLSSSITGSSVTRAGGGGGHDLANSAPQGGTGGGGNGGQDSSLSPTSGTTNTGGGGGGGAGSTAEQPGASGGSGVVILRVPTANYTGTTTGSPTVSVSGTDTVMIFNASGTYTG